MKSVMTPMWAVHEAGRAFYGAMGKQRLVLSEGIESGAFHLSVDVVPTDDMDLMRRRLNRAARMLADEAKRKRIRSVTPLGIPSGGQAWCVSSREFGVALRLTEVFQPMLGEGVYRIDMLGSRCAGRRVVA
jgi:hypothetical protein